MHMFDYSIKWESELYRLVRQSFPSVSASSPQPWKRKLWKYFFYSNASLLIMNVLNRLFVTIINKYFIHSKPFIWWKVWHNSKKKDYEIRFSQDRLKQVFCELRYSAILEISSFVHSYKYTYTYQNVWHWNFSHEMWCRTFENFSQIL